MSRLHTDFYFELFHFSLTDIDGQPVSFPLKLKIKNFCIFTLKTTIAPCIESKLPPLVFVLRKSNKNCWWWCTVIHCSVLFNPWIDVAQFRIVIGIDCRSVRVRLSNSTITNKLNDVRQCHHRTHYETDVYMRSSPSSSRSFLSHLDRSTIGRRTARALKNGVHFLLLEFHFIHWIVKLVCCKGTVCMRVCYNLEHTKQREQTLVTCCWRLTSRDRDRHTKPVIRTCRVYTSCTRCCLFKLGWR